MPKNKLQDIIKPQKKDSVINSLDSNSLFIKKFDRNREDIKTQDSNCEVKNKKCRKVSRLFIWLTILCVLVIVFIFFQIFSRAVINITSQKASVNVDKTFTASKETGRDGALLFDVMEVSDTATRSIPSDGVAKEVERHATGKVAIYNSFSRDPQKLLIETRLETSAGKIYKTDEAVVVPGYVIKNNQIAPGRVDVGIHSDLGGEDYNSGPIDFKIFGFKGTPKYEKFYARSIGDITGGAKGMVYSLNQAEGIKNRDEMKLALRDEIIKKAKAELPANFIMYDDAISVNIDNGSEVFEGTETNVPISTNGTLKAVIFNKNDLAKKIAEAEIEDFNNSDVKMPDLENLTFVLNNREAVFSSDVKEISFSLKGAGEIIWSVDEEGLINSLLGKKKADLDKILENYPNIKKADATIRPVWNTCFPKNREAIRIIEN